MANWLKIRFSEDLIHSNDNPSYILIFDFDDTITLDHSHGKPQVDDMRIIPLEYRQKLLDLFQMCVENYNAVIYINTRGIADMVFAYLTSCGLTKYITAVYGAKTYDDVHVKPEEIQSKELTLIKEQYRLKYHAEIQARQLSTWIWAYRKSVVNQMIIDQYLTNPIRPKAVFFDDTSINFTAFPIADRIFNVEIPRESKLQYTLNKVPEILNTLQSTSSSTDHSRGDTADPSSSLHQWLDILNIDQSHSITTPSCILIFGFEPTMITQQPSSALRDVFEKCRQHNALMFINTRAVTTTIFQSLESTGLANYITTIFGAKRTTDTTVTRDQMDKEFPGVLEKIETLYRSTSGHTPPFTISISDLVWAERKSHINSAIKQRYKDIKKIAFFDESSLNNTAFPVEGIQYYHIDNQKKKLKKFAQKLSNFLQLLKQDQKTTLSTRSPTIKRRQRQIPNSTVSRSLDTKTILLCFFIIGGIITCVVTVFFFILKVIRRF